MRIIPKGSEVRLIIFDAFQWPEGVAASEGVSASVDVVDEHSCVRANLPIDHTSDLE
jgi:hypothetical protein